MPAFDRGQQRLILEWLRENYPHMVNVQRPADWVDVENFPANAAYLEDHGLVEVTWRNAIGVPNTPALAKITARGIDFLADDGGLTAILGVVTVKLHEDTVRSLIADRIEASDLPAEEKSALRKRLETLTGDALKTATQEAVKHGLQRMPDAVAWIRTILGL